MRTLVITVAALALGLILVPVGGVAVTPSPATTCHLPTYLVGKQTIAYAEAHHAATWRCGPADR